MFRSSLKIRYIHKSGNCSRSFILQTNTYQKIQENNIEKISNENDSNESKFSINKKGENYIQKFQLMPKKLHNKPFIKNLFCGNYLYDYLKFPEFEHNLQYDDLNKNFIEPIKDYFTNTSYSKIINKNGNYTLEALNKFSNLNLYSKSIPKEYGGAELDSTGICRVLEEIGSYPSLGISLIYNNELAAKSILTYGTSEQKNNYLKRIARGELKGAFCYSELNNGADASRFNLIAKIENFDLNKKQYKFVLNGKKTWVSLLTSDEIENDNFLFIVTSKTVEYNENTEEEGKSLNLFIIEKNTPGLSINKVLNNQNGLNLYEIDFKDVRVTSDNLLGSLGTGFETSNKLIENSRFLIGSICVGFLKNLLKETIDFVNNTKRFGKLLSQFPLIKNKLANIETKLYTMESMTYLTAGIIDSYEVPDVGCEAALTKIYCTESLRECVNECLDIMGMENYERIDVQKKKHISDISYLMNSLNSNDVLRLYVATNGLVLAGIEFGEELTKVRNPFKYPGFILRQILINHRLIRSAQKKTPQYFYLWEHVHPSLNEPASLLEQSAVKFMMAAKSTIINHGRDVIDSQISLINLANMCMHLYALNSVLARASRSYSIGLPNSQHEIALTFVQAQESSNIINELHSTIIKSRSGHSLDNTKINIADKMLNLKQHAASHSISRNY